jgi:alpha-tubulin suppressor-like RCC1 family protein
MRRWGLVLTLAILGNALAFAACEDGIERDQNPRYYIPPDAEDERKVVQQDAPTSDANDSGNADADAGIVDAEAGVVFPALATGSGFHTDQVVIGHGDHSCAVVGPGGDAGDAGGTVWCWGANDHGQLGIGVTGDGLQTADQATATKIAFDETGLPFEGIDELALSGWHSCARKKDTMFCWGQRYSGAQAEPSSGLGPDRTRPRAIGNLDVVRIAADGPHSCATKANGKHVCFGHNTFNELGRGPVIDAVCTAPIFYAYAGNATHTCGGTLVEATNTIPKIGAITSGEIHGCAMSGDKVQCWGNNQSGQLGRPGTQVGEITPQEVVTDPALLTALDQVTALASGGKHSCAVRGGLVFCWGSNDAGQLGVPTATIAMRASAAAVAGITNVVSVGVAERISCAVKSDKTVWCWGADITSLPDGGAIVSTPTPTQVKGAGGAGVLDMVESVAPGFRHVCVRRSDSSVWCWGKNDRGQLGNTTKVDSPFPVKVTGLP